MRAVINKLAQLNKQELKVTDDHVDRQHENHVKPRRNSPDAVRWIPKTLAETNNSTNTLRLNEGQLTNSPAINIKNGHQQAYAMDHKST